MSLTLYDLTIPIMVRQLETLTDVLKQGEQWAKDNNKPESELLEASIYEDMRVSLLTLHSIHPNKVLLCL